MVLGFHSDIVFIKVANASNLSYQFPSLERDTEHWTNRLIWMCTFSLLSCWKTSVHRPLYVRRFCKKRFNLLFSCFVCNYVHINLVQMSYIVLSLWLAVRWMWAQIFSSKRFLFCFFFVKEQTTSGVQLWRFPYCYTVREVMFSADILNIFYYRGCELWWLFFFSLNFKPRPHESPQLLIASSERSVLPGVNCMRENENCWAFNTKCSSVSCVIVRMFL